MKAEEILMGSFFERKRRWAIYITNRRIAAFDRNRRFRKSLIAVLTVAASYLFVLAGALPVLLQISRVAPLVALAAFFPTMFISARVMVSRSRATRAVTALTPKLEIMKPEIDRVEMVKPLAVTGWGRLVVRSSSGGALEFALVGMKQFHHVASFMRLFTRDSSIVLVGEPDK